jgi:hypothetical protein
MGVKFLSEEPFAEPLRAELRAFLAGLQFAPCVSINEEDF